MFKYTVPLVNETGKYTFKFAFATPLQGCVGLGDYPWHEFKFEEPT